MPMFLLEHVVLFLSLSSWALAYTTFIPSCSSLDHEINFVYPGNTRSTLDILWTCLFTLIACTWTILHLNIPEQRADRDPGWRGDLKWTLKRIWTKTKWMLTAMLAPELLVGLAMGNLAHAKEAKDRLEQFIQQDGVPWSLTHSMFVDMGGLVIQAAGHNTTPSQTGSKVLPVESSQSSVGSQVTKCYHLTSFQFYMLRKSGILTRLPDISKEEINARSKSDAWSKTIAVVQITWLLIQVTVRTARGLAISQLELAVSAFSACGILTYALCWSKPKDCQVPIAIMKYPDGIPIDLLQILDNLHGIGYDGTSTGLVIPLVLGFGTRPTHGSNIRNDTAWNSCPPKAQPHFTNAHIANVAGVSLGSVIFGVVHILAWNFRFPTEGERKIWRTSSMIGTIVPVIFPCIGPIFKWRLLRKLFQWFHLFFRLRSDIDYQLTLDIIICSSLPIAVLIFVTARLYMLVEIFRTLLFLPIDAYTSTWTSNIPHVT